MCDPLKAVDSACIVCRLVGHFWCSFFYSSYCDQHFVIGSFGHLLELQSARVTVKIVAFVSFQFHSNYYSESAPFHISRRTVLKWKFNNDITCRRRKTKQNFFTDKYRKNWILPDCSVFCVDDATGRNRDPNKAQFNTIPESTSKVLRQPNWPMKNATSGAKMNVPRPDPATAIPFFIITDKSD